MGCSVPRDDGRLEGPPWVAEGDSATVEAELRTQYRQHGFIGVIGRFAGHSSDWLVSLGYADLDGGEALLPRRRMLAGSITKLITATLARFDWWPRASWNWKTPPIARSARSGWRRTR